MREVKLYTVNVDTVLAGDRVEIYEQVMPSMYMNDMSVTGVNQSPECLITERRIDLPVIHMRNDNGEKVTDEFVAIDRTLQRLIQCYKDGQERAEARTAGVRRDLMEVETELDRVKGMTFWQRVKWAFKPN